MYYLIFIIFFAVVAIIIAVAALSKAEDVCKNQESINIKAKEFLESTGFKESKRYYLDDFATYDKPNETKKFVAVDHENKKICFVDYINQSVKIVTFNELLNYEIYENGGNVTTGGNMGGLWGGFFAAETNGVCKELKLIIRLKNYETSQVVYELISNTAFDIGVNKSSKEYRKSVSSLQEFVSFLEIVKSENALK